MQAGAAAGSVVRDAGLASVPSCPGKNVNRYAPVHRTPDLAVSRVDHPPHDIHRDPEREVSESWGIAFVLQGRFDVTAHGQRCRLGPGSVFLTQPGFEYRCGHHVECPDDVCLSVRFRAEVVGEAEHGWARAGWFARRAAPRLAYTQRRLARAVEAADRFETERWALEGLAALAADSRDQRARGPYAVRGPVLDAVMAAVTRVESDPTRVGSVAALAREVGLTGASLSQAFRRHLGISPHQYVVRHRLARAATLLAGGAAVSDTCWRSGFENLSHFCRTFQRVFGVRASAWRGLSPTEKRRKVQALLRAAS